MCDEDDVLAASTVFIVILSAMNVALLMKRRCYRFWVRSSLLHGRKKCSATDSMRDLILDDQNLLSLEHSPGAGIQNFFWVSSSTFEEILNMIAPRMTRKLKIRLRNAIPIHKRLACILKFLASGDSYHSLQYLLKISKQTML